ncbi:MAG: hypothetical protein U0229_01180 [Anaeromyxobacter sp.]
MRRHALAFALVLVAACGGGGGGGGNDGGGGGGGGGGSDPVASHGGWTRGGNGTATGGGAGEVRIVSYGGDVQVKKATTLPAAPTVSPTLPGLGANPRTISADTELDPDLDDHVAGDLGGTATGLWVKAGATATLVGDGNDWATLRVAEGIVVDGTLRLHFRAGQPKDRGFAHLYARALHVSETGVVEYTGASGGGAGGTLQVETVQGITNRGLIDGRGGDGPSGGRGGQVVLEAGSGWLLHAGTIRANGGAATAGGGGQAGYVSLVVPCFTNSGGDGDVAVTGLVENRGGAGTLAGGPGGFVRVGSCAGFAVVTATLDSRGGPGSAGPGGDGGDIDVQAVNDGLWFLGKAISAGGDGSGASGGDGGEIGLQSRTLSARNGGALAAYVLADLDATGGDGASGGNGGLCELQVWQNAIAPATAGPLVVAGVDALLANGGDGGQAGGGAGPISIYSEAVAGAAPSPAGNVSIEPAIESFGGKATAANGAGGHANEVFLSGKVVTAPKVLANGGPPGPGGPGGDGGVVTVESTGGTSILAGALSVKGSAGTPAGNHGSVTVDGAAKSLTAGVYTP